MPIAVLGQGRLWNFFARRFPVGSGRDCAAAKPRPTNCDFPTGESMPIIRRASDSLRRRRRLLLQNISRDALASGSVERSSAKTVG